MRLLRASCDHTLSVQPKSKRKWEASAKAAVRTATAAPAGVQKKVKHALPTVTSNIVNNHAATGGSQKLTIAAW